LISSDMYIYAFWKYVLQKPVNTILIFQNIYIFFASGQKFIPQTPTWSTNSTWITLHFALFVIHDDYYCSHYIVVYAARGEL